MLLPVVGCRSYIGRIGIACDRGDDGVGMNQSDLRCLMRQYRFYRYPLSALVFSLGLLLSATAAFAYKGVLIDAETRQPVANAKVALGSKTVTTDADGAFTIFGKTKVIRIRAHGYQRTQRVIRVPRSRPLEIQLRPFSPRAVFVSLATFADREQRRKLFALFKTTSINALVIDIKSENGTLLWDGPRRAAEVGAGRRHVSTTMIKAVIRRLHSQGIYAIARIVVFKDDVIVRRHPEVALRAEDGSLLQEKDGHAWADPRINTVWDFNASIAVSAARLGFDEIQFDYIRFPVAKTPPRLCATDCSGIRRAAIRGFLSRARARLAKFNVFIGADVFGYTSWDPGDNNIGQKLEDIAAEVDYICPMLYPSSFRNGIPASRMPLDRPDKIVELSLRRAQLRTGVGAVRFRPWLQAFDDFSFDKRSFGRLEIGLQTMAADASGTNGWMLWQSHSVYVAADLP